MSEHENCHVDLVEKPIDEIALQTASAVALGVSGMGCPRCAMRVRNGLVVQEGVIYADVYLESGVATVAYDPAIITPDELVTAVTNSGNDGRHHYQAQVLQTVLASEAFDLS